MMLVSAINNRRLLGLLVFYAYVAPRTIFVATNCSESELSRLRRSANVVRHTQFLERGLERSFHRHRCHRAMAIWQFSGNHAALPRHFSNRFRLGLLSPRTK